MRHLYPVFLVSWFLVACSPAQLSESTVDFSSGEHVILGDLGYRSACQQTGLCGATLTRADGRQSFSYGELVAFSGDFYATPEEIYNEKVEPFFKWHRNDVNGVKKRFQQEVETIENLLHGHSDEAYPDFEVSYAWNYPDYLSLAMANTSHFGFYNMIAYIDYHGRALAMAEEAYHKGKTSAREAERLLVKALFTNAFADHFLTDGFASGHIRAPRSQILNWARAENLGDQAAGTLAKIIHDRDGEIRASGEHGLKVRNAHGDQWLTRCDSQLFWKNTIQDPSIDLPKRAVEASVREVLQAYQDGVGTAGVYEATYYVPFPSADELSLTARFPAHMSEVEYDKIMKQMAFYLKIKAFSGVDRKVLKKMTAALPSIMQRFRADVHQTILNNSILSQRLPTAYLDAYQMID